MTHADTLRGMADGQPIPWNTPVALDTRQDALIAGSDALTALDRVRDALTKLDRLDDDAWAMWERYTNMYELGRADAYHHAHTIITRALGDAP